MNRVRFSNYCPEACSLLSESLDEPLSELERAKLDAHLAVCEACAAFSREATAFTALLRAAPLEQAPRISFEPPRRPSIATRGIRVAAATAAVAALMLVALVVKAGDQYPSASGLATSRIGVAATQEPYVEQQLLELLSRRSGPTGRVVPT